VFVPDFPVSIEKEKALRDRMLKIGLREQDIEERFIRSGGHGGQNVNKVETCVYLKHIVSGLEVKCQESRSQGLNRYLARAILTRKLEDKILGWQSEQQQRIEKIRRQKRKRSKRAKEKILADKHEHSFKKEARKPVADL
jgi:protein subunit release factor B